MQMTMFDPRQTPTATAAMLTDRDLRLAIAAMREAGSTDGWPYVEALEGGLKAWAVDDHGGRYVAVFARLDEQVSA